MTEPRNVLDRTDARDQSFPPAWILAVLLRDRLPILGVVALGAVVGLLVVLLRPPHYSSTFSFLPQAQQLQGRDGLASLAGQVGVTLGALGGAGDSPQLYADLLKTREVLRPIAADSVTTSGGARALALSEFLQINGSSAPVVLERTIRALREKVIRASVAARTTGAVTVRARTSSPEASLIIAERLLVGLNRYNLVTRQTQATAERRFVEGRLEAARTSLRVAEDALQRFLQANRQFANSPELVFKKERLAREVALQEQVVGGLAQQNEDARIREVRDTPVITVIERPTLAVLPDPNHRTLIVTVGAMVAFLLSAIIALIREGFERQRRAADLEPSYLMLATEWQRFRDVVRRSVSGVWTRRG